jgi:hypothetical protein
LAIYPLLPRERLRRLTAEIYALGPRALFELFAELQDGAPLQSRLEAYARLAPLAGFIEAHGGRDLPPARLITRRRA